MFAAGALLVVLAGVAVLAFQLYYRSNAYRAGVEQRLGNFFGLPTDLGGIAPSGLRSRILTDVRMHLPGRRAMVFNSPRIVWDAGASSQGARLTIHDATLALGAGEWMQEDYSRVLRASLAHNFRDLNIHEVRFADTRVVWERRDVAFTAEGVHGDLVFDAGGIGRAKLACGVFNGSRVPESVQIEALVDPRTEELLPEVTLTVPRMPLTSLALDRVLQAPVTDGYFAGRMTLRQSAGGDEVQLRGKAEAIRLQELTAGVAGGPFPADVDLEIEDALVRGRSIERLKFSGAVNRMQVDPLLQRAGVPPMGGLLRLTVYSGVVERDQLRHLSVAGEWTGGSPDRLVQTLLGRGGVDGDLVVRLNNLVVDGEEVRQGDIDILVQPPNDGLASVDRRLLAEMFRKWLGVAIPEQMLPATVQFRQLGAKLEIAGRRATLTAPEGPMGRSLLTARVFGQDIALLQDVRVEIDLEPLLRLGREQLRRWQGTLRQRLESRPAG